MDELGRQRGGDGHGGIGHDQRNRLFATRLLELGRPIGDRAAVVRGRHAVLDHYAIAPDPSLLALVSGSEAQEGDEISDRLASLNLVDGGSADAEVPSRLSASDCDGNAWFDPDSPDDRRVLGVAYATVRTGARRLSILTGAWSNDCDHRLAAELAHAPALKRCDVWAKDADHSWPRHPQPQIDATIAVPRR